MRLVGYGDNIIDSFIDRQVDYPGGNSINVAVFAAQLGADSAYMGVFGSDRYGEYLQAVLDLMGIDHSRSVVRAGETGIARVEVIDGERVFRDGNDGGVTVREPIVLDREDLDYLATFDLIHSSVYSATESELPKLDELGRLTVFDFSGEDEFRRPAYLRQVAPSVDLALLSCSELSPSRTRETLRRVVAHGARLALGTRGAEGAVLFDGADFHLQNATAVPADATFHDTMGCGDAFLAAFTVTLFEQGWRRGTPLRSEWAATALRAGADFAARQCSVEGAFGNGIAWPAEDRETTGSPVGSGPDPRGGISCSSSLTQNLL